MFRIYFRANNLQAFREELLDSIGKVDRSHNIRKDCVRLEQLEKAFTVAKSTRSRFERKFHWYSATSNTITNHSYETQLKRCRYITSDPDQTPKYPSKHRQTPTVKINGEGESRKT